MVMVDHVGPFYTGDMHDFFVGLMGRGTSSQVETWWKGWGAGKGVAGVICFTFVSGGKDRTFPSYSEGSSTPRLNQLGLTVQPSPGAKQETFLERVLLQLGKGQRGFACPSPFPKQRVPPFF